MYTPDKIAPRNAFPNRKKMRDHTLTGTKFVSGGVVYRLTPGHAKQENPFDKMYWLSNHEV